MKMSLLNELFGFAKESFLGVEFGKKQEPPELQSGSMQIWVAIVSHKRPFFKIKVARCFTGIVLGRC
jgi:hypothetical protein